MPNQKLSIWIFIIVNFHECTCWNLCIPTYNVSFQSTCGIVQGVMNCWELLECDCRQSASDSDSSRQGVLSLIPFRHIKKNSLKCFFVVVAGSHSTPYILGMIWMNRAVLKIVKLQPRSWGWSSDKWILKQGVCIRG